MNELIESISEKEKKYDADFQNAQEAYAKRWNIDLVPNELEEQLNGE
jgi:hypothetical protein